MKLADLTTIVKNYIDDTTITVDQHVVDAVNFLSNIFSIKSIATGTTTSAHSYIAKPSLCVRVNKVFINDEEVIMLDDLENLDFCVRENLQRWYEYHGYIQLTFTPDNSTDVTKVLYDKGFVVPTAGVDTDVPDKFLELVYLGACYRYYLKIVSKVILHRSNYPDVSPVEIRQIAKHWRDQFDSLLKEIKTNAIAL